MILKVVYCLLMGKEHFWLLICFDRRFLPRTVPPGTGLHVCLSREEEDKRVSLIIRPGQDSHAWGAGHSLGTAPSPRLARVPDPDCRVLLSWSWAASLYWREGWVCCSRLGTAVSPAPWLHPLRTMASTLRISSIQRASVCPLRDLLYRMTRKLSVIAGQTGAVSGTEACRGCVRTREEHRGTGSRRLLTAAKTSSRANRGRKDSLA